MEHYAIEIIGYGAKARYCIKLVSGTTIFPVDRKAYRTEEAARAAADQLGIKIDKVGDSYQIM